MTVNSNLFLKFSSAIRYLHDPKLVAAFQNLCGVRRCTSNGVSKNGTKAKPHENGETKHHTKRDFVTTNITLDVLFQIGSALGNELFLTLFFSWFFWSVDSYVARRDRKSVV